jgi:hypothetical protein
VADDIDLTAADQHDGHALRVWLKAGREHQPAELRLRRRIERSLRPAQAARTA